MASRWCDQSIPDERHSAFSSGPLEVAILFGTLVAETILASVRVRTHKQAGHMDASDLIKPLQNTLQGGGRPHMDNPEKVPPSVERPARLGQMVRVVVQIEF